MYIDSALLHGWPPAMVVRCFRKGQDVGGDRLTAKHAGDDADPLATRPFSDWIRHVPKQKWALLYDTDGKRYGILTTDNADSYNMIMRGVRSLLLVGIMLSHTI